MKKQIVIIGEKYGKWEVISQGEPILESSGRKRKSAIVKCCCGEIKTIRVDTLKGGRSTKCRRCPIKGKNNPNWNGGITSLYNNIRNSLEYKEWRKKCFERDNYTCQISGVKSNLNVHHIYPFSLLIDDLDSNILFNIDNGITLSEDIHKKFHLKYGYKGFTNKDFEEFKKFYKTN